MVKQLDHAQQPQAFARLYRPQTFDQVVGQEHVLTALSYSLDQQNLHHAYLFTGTRGVGKTTLGRIFAKALNCEQGISASPCGQCSACTSIASGRFVDLIEVDGASNTKVEDTRELLEDVQFVPTQGRYKVYLIDEVHMLSTHSFNALLKTLEEPPEHVKFILATTDPQKLPATVLSRCLQFHLQLVPVPLIQSHLTHVLKQENITFDTQALHILAKAARGSMRDALTLTDQARHQGQGTVSLTAVTAMLGILDQDLAFRLLKSVFSESAAQVLTTYQAIENTGVDEDQLLQDLIEMVHQVALTQALGPQAQDLFNDPSLFENLATLAKLSSEVQVQLCFDTLLTTRKTLVHASTPATAVRMALLRMSCFTQFASDAVTTNPIPGLTSTPTISPTITANLSSHDSQAPAKITTPEKKNPLEPLYNNTQTKTPASATLMPHPQPSSLTGTPDTSATLSDFKKDPRQLTNHADWYELIRTNNPGGLLGQLLMNSRITQTQQTNGVWEIQMIVSSDIFGYDPSNTEQAVSRFLNEVLHISTRVSCQQESTMSQTPAQLQSLEKAQAQAEFEQQLASAPFMVQLKQLAEITVQPTNN